MNSRNNPRGRWEPDEALPLNPSSTDIARSANGIKLLILKNNVTFFGILREKYVGNNNNYKSSDCQSALFLYFLKKSIIKIRNMRAMKFYRALLFSPQTHSVWLHLRKNVILKTGRVFRFSKASGCCVCVGFSIYLRARQGNQVSRIAMVYKNMSYCSCVARVALDIINQLNTRTHEN